MAGGGQGGAMPFMGSGLRGGNYRDSVASPSGGFSAGMLPVQPALNSPFRGTASAATNMTGAGGYGGVQSMREGGIAELHYADGGTTNPPNPYYPGGDPALAPNYSEPRSAQEAYDQVYQWMMSEQYKNYRNSFYPSTQPYLPEAMNEAVARRAADDAKYNYTAFGLNPWGGGDLTYNRVETSGTGTGTGTGGTGTGTGTGTAPSAGSRVQTDIGQAVNNLTQEEQNRLANAVPVPKPGSESTYGRGTGTGTWGGGGGQANPYAPTPIYTAPEYPDLAFGYQWIPERLKALRAQEGLVPGGGGISTVPPSVSTTPISAPGTVPTKAAKDGGIMSLMRQR